MLNWQSVSEKDNRIRRIIVSLNQVLANQANVVEKRHVVDDMCDCDVYTIWGAKGIEICRVNGCLIAFGESENGIILPTSVSRNIEQMLEKRCVKGDATKLLDYNLLMKRFATFSR